MAGVITGVLILMAACIHLFGDIVYGRMAVTWAAAIMEAGSSVVVTTVVVTL